MTLEERIAKLDKRHHHFVHVADPWHIKMLAAIPEVLVAANEHRITNGAGDAAIHAGELFLVWFSMDKDGNLLQEWGLDPPPADVVVIHGTTV